MELVFDMKLPTERQINWAHSVLNDTGSTEKNIRAATSILARNGESPRSIEEDAENWAAEVRDGSEP